MRSDSWVQERRQTAKPGEELHGLAHGNVVGQGVQLVKQGRVTTALRDSTRQTSGSGGGFVTLTPGEAALPPRAREALTRPLHRRSHQIPQHPCISLLMGREPVDTAGTAAPSGHFPPSLHLHLPARPLGSRPNGPGYASPGRRELVATAALGKARMRPALKGAGQWGDPPVVSRFQRCDLRDGPPRAAVAFGFLRPGLPCLGPLGLEEP
jgi:hypothetical protein